MIDRVTQSHPVNHENVNYEKRVIQMDNPLLRQKKNLCEIVVVES